MDIIQEAKNLALKEIEEFGDPVLNHFFEILEKRALELSEKLNADKKIVNIGAYLLDLKLPEAIKLNKIKEHVKMSVEAAKPFLEKFNLDKETENRIMNCIEAHHGDVPYICKEAEICANADCYKFLHPKGFLAYFSLLGKRELEFNNILDRVEEKADEKYKILSLDICKQELEEHYDILKKLLKSARGL